MLDPRLTSWMQDRISTLAPELDSPSDSLSLTGQERMGRVWTNSDDYNLLQVRETNATGGRSPAL
jgi:hypothetical protein